MTNQWTVLSNGRDTWFTSRLSGGTNKMATARPSIHLNELHTGCVPFHDVNVSRQYKI